MSLFMYCMQGHLNFHNTCSTSSCTDSYRSFKLNISPSEFEMFSEIVLPTPTELVATIVTVYSSLSKGGHWLDAGGGGDVR